MDKQPKSSAKGQPETPNTMSVAEAALALSVSRTAVYRMDRQNGPFKILKRGRRVLIDRDGLNRYLSGRALQAPADHPLPAENSSCYAPGERSTAKSGQRELAMPNRRAVVVFYVY